MADRTVRVTILAQASQYVSEFQKMQSATRKQTDDTEKNLARQKAAMQSVGVAALAMGTVAAAGLLYMIKTTADFDAQMSQVKSLSHATAAEMGELRTAALEAGQGIGLSASQVADAETELVKAGVSVKDQLGGALVGTLNLAAAGQMNVADATQIAASAMTQFKLSGKDVPHIADLLAAGADKALGSVSDLGEGLKYVGPVAQSMGVSIDQTVGTLSLFAQNGILAEQAGTGLRGVLLSLTSPSKLASDVMKQYGINVYDASGKFVGLDGVAQQLKTHLGGLDEATRNQALGQIFGNQQITQATILMQGGSKAVDKWTKAVNDNGFAAQQAAGKMDNLNGDVSKLGAAFQTDIIKSGSGANEILRGLTQGLSNLVRSVGDLPGPVLDVGVGITALVAGVGLLGGGFLLLTPKIAATRAAMADLQLTGKGLITGLGKGGGLLLVLTSLASGFANLGAQSELSADRLAKVNSVMGDLSKQKLNGLFSDAVLGTVDATKSTDKFKESLNALASGNFFDNKAGAPKFIDGMTFGLTHLSDVYKTNEAQFRAMGSSLAETAKTDFGTASSQFDVLVKAAGGGKEAIRQLLTEMPDYKASLIDLASQNGKTLSQTELFNLAVGKGALAQELAVSSTKKNDTALAELKGTAEDTTGSISDLSDAITNFGKGALDVDSASRAFQQALDDMTDSVAKNGATLDLNTQAGRDNDAALSQIAQSTLGLASAQATAGASSDTLSGTLQTGRDAFIAAALAAGATADQANALATQYGLVPANVTTAITVTGAGTASAIVQGFIDMANRIPNSKVLSIGVDVTNANIPSAYIQANGGVMDFYARGGLRESHVAQIAPAGAMRVWAEPETGGEAYIPLAQSKRERSLSIWQATGKRLGVQGFADGGVTYVSAPPRFSGGSSSTPMSLDGMKISGTLDLGNGLVGMMQGVVNASDRSNARRTSMGRQRGGVS